VKRLHGSVKWGGVKSPTNKHILKCLETNKSQISVYQRGFDVEHRGCSSGRRSTPPLTPQINTFVRKATISQKKATWNQGQNI